ncbi:hypothetical protein [Bifidobacterium sp.]|jgi:hypothetical protein|uniref:hypothetical protein n=1 Tax=Bifidobacterium sp. TaxID=41200 RepID=UPI0025B9BF38|nr:hypothetical protein [Bifidobacterium sp.]MCH4209642.1 hypothetical protein [Bifidobacterium sp.]MCI1224831.1 hypothetical protein [Bifidobacterium sp.]
MSDSTSSHRACTIIVIITALSSLALVGASVYAGMSKRKEARELTGILQSSTQDLSNEAKRKILDTIARISTVLAK